MSAFRDSVYTKTQTLAGNKTLSGNIAVGGTLGVTGATTLANTLAVTGATTLTGNLTANGTTASFPNATAVTFPNANPTVKAKSAVAVLANTTQLATEAQVALAQNTASTALSAFRDSIYTKAQTLAGNKTFSGTNIFTVSPTVPSKATAAGNNPTVLATEAQVYAVAAAGKSGLSAFRDSVYTKAQTLAGNKTLSDNTSVGGTLAVTGATTLSRVCPYSPFFIFLKDFAPFKLLVPREKATVFCHILSSSAFKTFFDPIF
ncbi:hypothetical protein AGMMS49525_18590 [Bacteroidia bacterium]|nr:hypothetical protein AGMMS49525_18590 [Bacteroidia bacterium]